MAFSVNTPVGDGTTVQFAVNFTNGIFSRDSVSVAVDGELDGAGDQIKRDFIWINDGLIELTGAAPASGAVIRIRRIMDKSNPAVDYADGEILTEANLDRSNDQLLNAIQELSDGFGFSSLQGDINLNGNTITGIGTSALSSSAVTLQQLEDAVFTGGTSVLSDALSSDVPGKGASLVSMEYGPTVETAVTTNAKDILDRVIRATSIAEIETYSAPVGYVFSLNAGGRSGVFDVIAGDFSAELAADTLNGIYVGLADDPTATDKVAMRRNINLGLTPEMFGITSSDANSSAGLNTFFSTVPENQLCALDNTYTVSEQIKIEQSVRVIGKGKIKCDVFNKGTGAGFADEPLVYITGVEGSAVTTISGEALYGSVSFSVADASGISEGDILYLESNTIVQNGRTTSFKRQHIKVRSVSTNVINCDTSLAYNYANAETVSVYKHSYLNGVSWDGVSVEQQVNDSEITGALRLEYCAYSTVSNADFREGTRACLWIRNSFQSDIINCNCALTTSPINGLEYAALLSGSSHCKILGGEYSSTRTAIDLSESDNCSVLNVTAAGNINTHVGTSHIIDSSYVDGQILIRSERTQISSNRVRTRSLINNNLMGVIFFQESGSNGGHMIVNNHLTLSHPDEDETCLIYSTGITSGQYQYPTLVQGNIAIGVSPDCWGIDFGPSGIAESMSGVSILNNTLSCGDRAIIYSRASDLIVSGNRISMTNVTDNIICFFAFQSGGADIARVLITSNNILFPAAGSNTKTLLLLSGSNADQVTGIVVNSNLSTNDTTAFNWASVPVDQKLEVGNMVSS